MNADELDNTLVENIRPEKIEAAQILRARTAFDASVVHIDADTQRRLRDARAYALRPRSAAHFRPAWALPIGAAFATAFALLAFWPHASPPAPALPHQSAHAAMAAVAPQTGESSRATPDSSVDSALADSLIGGGGSDGADPELLGNLDFYGWLAKQPALTRSGG